MEIRRVRGGFGFMGREGELVNLNGNENQNQKSGTSLLSLLVHELLLSFLNQNGNWNQNQKAGKG